MFNADKGAVPSKLLSPSLPFQVSKIQKEAQPWADVLAWGLDLERCDQTSEGRVAI